MPVVTLNQGGTYVMNHINSSFTNVTGSSWFSYSGVIEEDIELQNVYFSNDIHGWINPISLGDGAPMKFASGDFSIYSNNSTRKVKKNISPLSDHISINSILKLEGRSFRWNEDNSLDIGFIAEEVAEVYPLFATTNSRSLEDRAILTAVVELIKDLDSRVKILEKEKI